MNSILCDWYIPYTCMMSIGDLMISTITLKNIGNYVNVIGGHSGRTMVSNGR